MRTLDIVIVNWNSKDYLKNCLRSLIKAQHASFQFHRIIIVDNASTDHSLEGIENLPLPLKIIRNSRNMGFGKACNQGAANSLADYILFLNPDTCVNIDSLWFPIEMMEKEVNERIGICGIKLLDESGMVAKSCSRFPKLSMFIIKILGLESVSFFREKTHHMLEWDYSHNRVVDQVIGAFFLVRKKLFKLLDGFDERFFVYFEEVDFSYRAKLLNWDSLYIAEASAWHKGGGVSQQIKSKRLFYSLRSRILYGYKHFNPWAATLLLFSTFLIEPLTRFVQLSLKFSLKEIKNLTEGYYYLWRDLPCMLKKIWKK